MLRSRIDRAFRTWLQDGDPQALARVFDATAPELYRLAWHLIGNRHAAEDLVQTTFLVAIQDARSFAAGSRVMPWLCGILANRALHQRRQARLHEGPVIVSGAAAAGPAALAEAQELRETVAAAVRSLPDPYRQVLLLHLLHELTPKEVAEALARPDATVRVQLHRGLDLLRKVLPAGVAALARAAAPLPIGLPAVRAVVLAEAGRQGAVAAGVAITTLGGVLLMKKVLFGVGVLLALLGVWSMWPSFEPPVRPGAAVGTAASAAVATADMPTTVEIPASPIVREEVPPPAGSERASLEVFVRWSDGTPAADATVRCIPVRSHTGHWYESVGRDSELRLRAARTNGAGIAHFDDLWPGKALATAQGGKVEVELAAGAPHRYTLDIPRGFDVRGRVLGPDDRAIAGATVWLSVAPNSDDSEPVAITGTDGVFAIRSAGRTHVISATAPGYSLAHIDWVSEERAKEERILRLRRAPGVLVGTVLDDVGRPVANARVLVGVTMAQSVEGVHQRPVGEIVGQDLWPSRFLRTDTAGTFRTEGLPPLPWPIWVGAPGFAPTRPVVDVIADGETSVTVRLEKGARIRGHVTDEAGAPVADAEVSAWYVLPPVHEQISIKPRMSGNPLWTRLTIQTDAKGNYALDQIMAGKIGMSVWGGGATARSEFEVANGQQLEWSPQLERQHRLHGCIVDEAGQPLIGWNIRYEAVENARDSSYVGTNPQGAFRTAGLKDAAYRLSVEPSYPSIGARVPVGEFRPGPDVIRIVVPHHAIPTGALRGQILAPDETPCTSGNVLVFNLTTRQSTHASVEGEGRFQSPKLSKGRYRVTFDSTALGEHVIGECDVPDDGVADLGVFRVPAPGRLVVTIVDSRGAVMPAAWLNWRGVDDQGHGGSLTHREGHVSGFLRPGRYLLMTRKELPIAAMEVDVQGSETTEVRFVMPDGVRFVLRIPSAASSDRNLEQVWRNAQGAMLRTWHVESDEPGKDLERSAPPGRYTIEVRDADGLTATTTFDLRATDPPMVVELPLPAPK